MNQTWLVVPSGGFRGWLSRFLLHPFEIAFGVLFLVAGSSMIRELRSGGTNDVSQSILLLLPDGIVWMWAVCSLLAGIGIVYGCLWPDKNESRVRAISKAALLLGAATWATYAVTVWTLLPVVTILGVLNLGVIVLACLGRVYALHRVDKAVEQAQTHYNREASDG